MASSEAAKEASRKWYQANRERQLQLRKAHYARNKDKYREWSAAWKAANRETVREWARRDWKKHFKPEVAAAWRARNAERIRVRERNRYHSDERYKVTNAIKTSRRRRALCAWANHEMVRAFYVEARRLTTETGIEHAVDHVIPIKGELVCGLHNEFNLRVITRSENARKKNRFDPSGVNA